MSQPRSGSSVDSALVTLRWTEEARHWLHPGMLPATAEQLTAQLMALSAPSWLLWRLNAAVPDNRVLDSVDAVVRLLQHPDRHGLTRQTQYYAG
jgi:hypothetical protein